MEDEPCYTEEEIAEAGERMKKERRRQGLPEEVTDVAALAPVARAFNRVLEAEAAA